MPTAAYQHSLSSPGYLPDMAHGELPPQAWTGGSNMELTRGALRTIDGFVEAYSITTSILHAVNAYTATSNFWVAATETQLIATDGSTTQAITRISASSTLIPYTHPATGTWSSAVFGNYLVINNGNDVPQSWALSFSAPAADLSGWPATWTNARVVRAFRNYLVAMDITISGTRYPSLVAWSDAAPFSLLPSTWTPATTNDAGDNELNDTGGWIIDAAPLGGSLAIYKEDSIWAMSHVGGSTVMAFRKLFTGVGLLAIHCVQEFNGQHMFVGRGDVYVTDGINLRSIAAGRVREKLFADMNPTYYERTFTAVDRVRREIWICYPTVSAWPDKALVWNYETDMWYPPRDIPPSAYMAGGILDLAVAGTTFAASDGTSFDATTDPFDIRSYNPSETELLACVPSLRRLYQAHNGSGIPYETAITNLLIQTSAFENAAWTRTNTTVSTSVINAVLAPDGTTTGDKLTELAANAQHLFRQDAAAGTTPAGQYTGSIYAKAAERSSFHLQVRDSVTGSNVAAVFNMSTGVKTEGGVEGSEFTLIGSTFTQIGEGWWRASISGIYSGTAALRLTCTLRNPAAPAPASYTGVVDSGLYLWGAQLQAQRAVTDYITTTASPVTTLVSDYTGVSQSIERKLIPFVGQDATGGAALWSPAMKTVRRVWLDATGTGIIRVYLGVHPNESTDPTWYGPYSIDLSSQHFAWCLLRGRFFSIKFESDSDSTEWALTGYKLEYELSGGF